MKVKVGDMITNSASNRELVSCPQKTKAGRVLLTLLAAIVILAAVATAAWAVPEPRRIDTKNVTKFEETGAIGEAEVKGGHTGQGEVEEPGKLSEEKALREGEAEEEGEEGEEEHIPAWMFPGWQTVFALLAVGYYAFMLTFLPKIMAKDEGHH